MPDDRQHREGCQLAVLNPNHAGSCVTSAMLDDDPEWSEEAGRRRVDEARANDERFAQSAAPADASYAEHVRYQRGDR